MSTCLPPTIRERGPPGPRFVLRLFVAGPPEQFKDAILNVKKVCPDELVLVGVQLLDLMAKADHE